MATATRTKRAPETAENPPEGPQTLALPVNVAQAVLNYLATRPYQEVFQLVGAIQSLQPLAADDE